MAEIKRLKAIPLLPSVSENETLKTKKHLDLVMGAERNDPWRWWRPTCAAAATSSPHTTASPQPPRHGKAPGLSGPAHNSSPRWLRARGTNSLTPHTPDTEEALRGPNDSLL